MSGQATGWVLRHGPKDRAMRAVLVTIADAANRDGDNAHPGTAAMIDGSGYSRATVFAALDRLEAEGWVVVTERGKGRGHATVYSIPGVDDPTWTAGGKVQSSDLSADEKVQERSEPAAEKVQSGSPPPISPTVSNGGNDARALGDTGFDHFWVVYPARNGRKIGKAEALAQWRKLGLDDRKAAWRGARNMALDVTAGHALPPDAHRWLRKRTWEDWQTPPTGSAPANTKVARGFAAIDRVLGDEPGPDLLELTS